MTTTATGQPDQEVYTDALGREVRIGEKRFNGKYLYTDKVYDNKGSLQQSSPYGTDIPMISMIDSQV